LFHGLEWLGVKYYPLLPFLWTSTRIVDQWGMVIDRFSWSVSMVSAYWSALCIWQGVLNIVIGDAVEIGAAMMASTEVQLCTDI
jgi:hypothetical protein